VTLTMAIKTEEQYQQSIELRNQIREANGRLGPIRVKSVSATRPKNLSDLSRSNLGEFSITFDFDRKGN